MQSDRIRARREIEKLVAYFDKNIYQLKAPSFNEAQTRQYLIDPMFEALGWDVRNTQMLPPYKIEVIPEGRVKTNIKKFVKEQQALFSRDAAVKEEMKEYISMLEYIADDEYKAEQLIATKKPDYRFRIGGATKYFVEAKKPSVDLMNNVDAIFQIKRYGFSARVPISILTDFEEFRVFDCTRKPFYDRPKLGVIKEFDITYKAYLDQFDKLYDTFSREAVLAGSIEMLQKKYLEKKTGEFTLDRAFLDDLSDWRIELAQDIAKYPKNRRILNSYTLNECVQRILDRVVFFRVCEDRTILVENELLAIIQLWQTHPGLSLYEQFNNYVRSKRDLFNGLLFAPHECEQLEVGNKVFEKILRSINYPNSPYHFDEIGVEILGSIYEQFLGKAIRLTQKQVRVEEKPEVRKAGGVYYTPPYIVNYIVDNTLGKLLYGEEMSSPSQGEVSRGNSLPRDGGVEAQEPLLNLPLGKGEKVSAEKKLKLSPKQVAKLKIIDIACGSGSFLLGAFQKLIDYHIEWYSLHPEDIKEENGVRDVYEDMQGQLHLSARKKREILVNNIYGVDIDQQAAEVTQMSLYLKVLEDENDATLNKPTMLALHEVLLPPMKNSIKCGNSLIGTDFAAQGEMFDDTMRHKVNPFDWEAEFPEILGSKGTPSQFPPTGGEVRRTEGVEEPGLMTPSQPSPARGRSNGGGFDVVIGNPPYVRQESLGKDFKEYVCGRYKCFISTADLFVYFIEKAHSILKTGGYFGVICSGKFMRTSYGEPLRKFLLAKSIIHEIIDFGELPVFEGASTFPIVLITQCGKIDKQQFKFVQIKSLTFDSLANEVKRVGAELDSSSLDTNGWTLASRGEVRLINKLKSKGITLSKFLAGEIHRGILTGLNEAFVINEQIRQKILSKDKKAEPLIRKFVIGDDIRKYMIKNSKSYIILMPNGWTRKEFGKVDNKWTALKKRHPSIASHIEPFIARAQKRLDKGEYWWELRPCDYYSEMEKPKIIWPEIAKESRFTFDDSSYSLNKTCFFTPSNDKYLLGILNSRTIWFFLKSLCSVLGDAQKGGRLLQQKIYLEQLPIRTIDFDNPAEKKMHDNLVGLVDEMLKLNKELQGKSFDSEREPLERQIAATDKKIDELVYQLYGLTEEEIRIVEKQD
jgi:type I restriction-modification system DNA methylase subunit/predicted type IV restriction endonuclease